MSEITSKLSLQKKSILITLLILCSCVNDNDLFSRNHWNRDFVQVSYIESENSITMKFKFIDYEFGPQGEHAFLEWCYFTYTINDIKYDDLMRCEVIDQVLSDLSWMTLKQKLPGANIQFLGSFIPEDKTMWETDTNVAVQNSSNKAYLTIKWFVPKNTIIKVIRIFGEWHVNGLNCYDFMDYEIVYEHPSTLMDSFKKEEASDSRQIDENTLRMEQPGNKAVAVYKEADAVGIKGVERGESVRVYSSSGIPIYSNVANDDETMIKLPPNQFYIVNVGHAIYKIAL